MQENLTLTFNKIKESINKLSKKVKIIIVAVAAIIIAGALFATIMLNNKPFEVLFTGLNQQETTEITGKLQEMEVPLKLEGQGTILVPQEQVLQLKATLVSQGYPKSGFTYDIFKENINLMSTDDDKANFLLFSLQDRIAATIRLFEGVTDATVTLVIGQDKKYVLEKDKVKSSAGIAIDLEDGYTLSKSQVNGIRRLVSKSIPDVVIEDIVIVDGEGNELLANENMQVTATELKRKLELEYENAIKSKIQTLIEPIFGNEKFRIAVNTVYDIDKKIKEVLNYIPSEENEGKGVVSSEKTGTETVKGEQAEGDLPGTDSNAEVPTYPGITTDGNDIYFKDDKSYEYLVSQVKEQIDSDAGVMTDASISLTIDSQTLSEEQSASLKKLIANAAGINTNIANQKVEILYLPYMKDDPGVPNPVATNPMYIYIGIGGVAALLFITLIILLFVLKGKKKKKLKLAMQESQTEEGEEFGVVKMQKLHELQSVEAIVDTREKELQKEIGDFADANPEIAAQLLKTWLRGGEGSE